MNRPTFRPKTLMFLVDDSESGAGTGAPATGEVPPEVPAGAPDGETPPSGETPPDGETPPEGEQGKDGEEVASLPDWAQSEIRRLRTEAASRRVRERELEDKLSQAKTPEEFEAAVTELREANAALERTSTVERLTASLGLSADAVELLADVPTEALEERAKKLARLAGVSDSGRDPSGGLDPTDKDGDFDPVAAAKAARARRY